MPSVIPDISKTIKMRVGSGASAESRTFTTSQIHIDDPDGNDTIWVPAQAMNLISKNITTNGTYNAVQNDGVGGYSEVTVEVQGGESYLATLDYGIYHEEHVVPKFGGCTFEIEPYYPVYQSTLPTAVYCLDSNPKNITRNTTFTMVSKTINRTEITDSWDYLVTHPEEYDIGQYKTWDFGDIDFDYHGNTITLRVNGNPIRKVAQYDHPLEGHNGYAKTTWCFDNRYEKAYWQDGMYISNNTDYATGWGWGEDPNGSLGYKNVREFLGENGALKAFPDVLKNAIVPVLNKSTLYVGGACVQAAETLDKLWIPSWQENLNYVSIFGGTHTNLRRNGAYFLRDIVLDKAWNGVQYTYRAVAANGSESTEVVDPTQTAYRPAMALAFCL